MADGYYPNKNGSDKPVTVQQKDYFNDNQTEKVADATIENKVYTVGVKTNNLKQSKVTMAGYLRDIRWFDIL
ncbi:MAG: hypothetical protein EOP45_15815 [Sphingobacteriaceae bacterium]|nr:MAG: hypothetical protein EOP45_15815 [Sphingobacteriaceae bacterium]